MRPREHYQALFGQLVAAYGPMDEETITSVIGFSAGGPVSLCTIANQGIIVSCELSLYREQKRSSEGFRYEFLSKGTEIDVDQARTLFTGLGALSTKETLGDGHTIDVSPIIRGIGPVITLRLFSRTRIGLRNFGIYEITTDKGST
jgi:hypothetical protein